jgi:hypothetical protein
MRESYDISRTVLGVCLVVHVVEIPKMEIDLLPCRTARVLQTTFQYTLMLAYVENHKGHRCHKAEPRADLIVTSFGCFGGEFYSNTIWIGLYLQHRSEVIGSDRCFLQLVFDLCKLQMFVFCTLGMLRLFLSSYEV